MVHVRRFYISHHDSDKVRTAASMDPWNEDVPGRKRYRADTGTRHSATAPSLFFCGTCATLQKKTMGRAEVALVAAVLLFGALGDFPVLL